LIRANTHARLKALAFFVSAVLASAPADAASGAASFSGGFAAFKQDLRAFYLDTGNLWSLGAGIAASGVAANARFDEDFHEYYQDTLRGGWTDDLSSVFTVPGDVFVMVPAVVGARLVLGDGVAGQWAGRTLRAYLVGGPAGLAIQRLTGASRPSEDGSEWRPFSDSNGLSGHAFTGAVPFMTAARMQRNAYLKGLLYAVSLLPAASRVNDGKHYLSQAALGWYLAYLSVRAVDRPPGGQGCWRFDITPSKESGFLASASLDF
jgi:membrane-associated phospholipid phosphatase